jgi:hypothetical protein
MANHWLGLDLGKYTDFCALSIMRRELAIDENTRLPLRNSIGLPLCFWRVLGLRRWPLRTPYAQVVKDVVKIARRPDIKPAPQLAIDRTGIGGSVEEMVRTALDAHWLQTWSVNITAGESWRRTGPYSFNVAKVQIVSVLAETLGSERLMLCPRSNGEKMENQDVLERELAAFRVRVKASGYQSVEAMGSDHDDCVICISLPLWLGAQRFMEIDTTISDPEPWQEPSTVSQAERAALIRERDEPSTRQERQIQELTAWIDVMRAKPRDHNNGQNEG